MKHIVVVGSGIAGLIAALEIGQRHAVTLVTKAKLAESNTRYAQGGIAAAMTRDDSVAEHVSDTLRAGAGLCDPKAVEVLCAEGPARIRDLIRLGVTFDYRDGELARGLEAAHTRARILHAGGDATGLNIETALVRAVRARVEKQAHTASPLRVLEETFACEILLRDGRADVDNRATVDRRAAGIEVLHADGTHERIEADAVVLASGGAGQIYQHTTNPTVATGDGIAMALRAGAQVADVEFYQFHPTLLAAPGAPFLISEAVRGEGAVLQDAHGRRFMQAVHPAAELAPRDVVARAIAMQMAEQGGAPVLLDATRLGAELLRQRFPTIGATCAARGLDWTTEPIPVTPAAHYWMGGVRTDLFGRTNVRGLFAVGEVACTGVHGANRLASNSLLESLVFAWRCAHLLLSESPLVEAGHDWPVSVAAGASGIETVEEPLTVDRATLQRLMWEQVGIQRDGDGLRFALKELARWKSGRSVRGDDVRAEVAARELDNLLLLARAIAAAALEREESRGAHFRLDFPETDPEQARPLVFESSIRAKDAALQGVACV